MRTCRNCKEKLIAIRGNGVAYIKDLSAFIKSDKVKRQLEGVRRLRMRSKGNAPTAAQKRWYGTVAEQGCKVCSNEAQVHHCVGTTGKHQKIHIGHWFVIPLCDEHHRALHGGETFGFDSRKEFEKNAYLEVSLIAALQDQETPDWQVGEAIRNYHR